jgi:hypothetical protein
VLTIISANAGGYDTPKQHVRQTVPCRWIQVNDDPGYGDMHPRMQAKHVKVFPWLYGAGELSVWIDSSFRIVSPHFASAVLQMLRDDDIVQFRHWGRDCIYDEAMASITMQKYAGEKILEQVEHYRAYGHPPHWGLWECGVLARRRTAKVEDMCTAWWGENTRWSWQDQLSWPVILRLHNVRPGEFPGTRLDQPWLEWQGHTRDD